jgi:hypothetical protein
MGKVILTFHDIIELNHQLEEKELPFKIHLHDACGSQSFSIEILPRDAANENVDEMKQVIEQYFINRKILVKFTDNMNFVVLQ